MPITKPYKPTPLDKLPIFQPNTRIPYRTVSTTAPKGTFVGYMMDEYLASHSGEPLPLEQHQIRILNHMFTPFGQGQRLRYRTMVWSCPKKSGKTELASAVGYAWAKVYGGDIYSIANDKVQAKERAFNRLAASLEHKKKAHPDRFAAELDPAHHKVIVKNDEIRFANGALVKAIPCDPYGEAGGMQTLTIWDELWGYRHELAQRLWTEMQPLPEGVGVVKESARFVVTYAGWFGESELLWNLYDQVCKPNDQLVEEGIRPKELHDLPVYVLDDICVYWDHEARMSWHTDAFLAAAKREEPRASEYQRIWENRWTTGLEAYLDMGLYDRQATAGGELGLYNHLQHIHPILESDDKAA